MILEIMNILKNSEIAVTGRADRKKAQEKILKR